MRQVVRILFVTVYLSLTVGVSIATHLCGDEPVSAGLLTHPPTEPADCCGPAEPIHGCCSTVVTTIRINGDQMLIVDWQPFFTAVDLPPTPAIPEAPDPHFVEQPYASWSPPDGHPLHILHSSLLI